MKKQATNEPSERELLLIAALKVLHEKLAPSHVHRDRSDLLANAADAHFIANEILVAAGVEGFTTMKKEESK